MSKIENMIRKSSLIYNYGIGGLWTNNTDETFIIKAPKFWKWDSEMRQRGVIIEENLRRLLGVKNILFPPGAKDKQIKLIHGTLAIGRFPGWHRCKGWRRRDDGKSEPCGSMIQLGQEDNIPLCSDRNCTGSNPRTPSRTFAPVRFMVICDKGHLDEFPFQFWVHQREGCDDHKLRYVTTPRSGLSGIFIECESCSNPTTKVRRPMSGALTPDTYEKMGIKCTGKSPWLDENSTLDKCSFKTLTGVQKSSSNLLFPIIRNAIFCPSYDVIDVWIKKWVDNHRIEINNALDLLPQDDDLWPTAIRFSSGSLSEENITALLAKVDDIKAYMNPTPIVDPFIENGYRGIYQREYERFLNFPVESKLDDFTISRPNINTYTANFQKHFSKIGLLEKLRDTRVYVGFSRIEPTDRSGSEEILNCYGANEVIGDIVRGEGIFIQINSSALQNWVSKPEVKGRYDLFTKSKKDELLDKYLVDTENDSMIYLLLHSLAHCIIGEVSAFSGYNTASIRERIYVGSDGIGGQMHGILLHTSNSDSEGSLGGLVRLGKAGVFEQLIEQAVKRATWCSSDPLCSHSVPKGAKGSNLAACHHCLLLPETCCEGRNEFLDRELIISINNPNLGFYNL